MGHKISTFLFQIFEHFQQRASSSPPPPSPPPLKQQKKNINAAVECVICLENIDEKQMHKTKCLHVFHNLCITRWISTSATCPVCRSVLEEHEEEHKAPPSPPSPLSSPPPLVFQALYDNNNNERLQIIRAEQQAILQIFQERQRIIDEEIQHQQRQQQGRILLREFQQQPQPEPEPQQQPFIRRVFQHQQIQAPRRIIDAHILSQHRRRQQMMRNMNVRTYPPQYDRAMFGRP